MKFVFLMWIPVFISGSLLAQTPIGRPLIRNFNSVAYKAGRQNRVIDQDRTGRMYFGNSEGLLTFDGKSWKLYPLPNRTMIRTMKIASDGKIFIGGQNELGYYFPAANGSLTYHSLKPLIPVAEREFADIWNIVIYNDQVFFRAINKIFLYEHGHMRVSKPASEWSFLGTVSGKIFAQQKRGGIFQWNNSHWIRLFSGGRLKNFEIKDMMKYSGDTVMAVTAQQGLFLLDIKKGAVSRKSTNIDASLQNDRISYSLLLDSQTYAFGTVSAGLRIIDKKGQLVRTFSAEDGLQKNYIRSIFIDNAKNMWLGQDDGIDFLAVNSAISYIYPDQSRQATSYSFELFGKSLYVGTSNGLYSAVLDKKGSDLAKSSGRFEEVRGIKGQIWQLTHFNNHLVIAHEEGLSILGSDGLKSLYSTIGTWKFQPLNQHPSAPLIAGTYRGLRRLNLSNGSLKDNGTLGDIRESLRFLCWDNNTFTLWASHPYIGVFKIDLTSNLDNISKLTRYNSKDGLPSSLGNCVFKVKNKIVVTTVKGIYEYNTLSNKFVHCASFGHIFKEMSIQYLKEDLSGNLWFVSDKKIGVVDFSRPEKNRNFSIIYFPELSEKIVSGFEYINPIDQHNILINANKGVIHLDYQQYNLKKPEIGVILGEIKISGLRDSILFGGYTVSAPLSPKPLISHGFNSIQFQYGTNAYEQLDNVRFTYQLEGFSDKWSQWDDKGTKDFTNLAPGDYVFRVKAQNNLGRESETVSYTFTILPAWYQSFWAYLFYICAACLLIYYLFRWQTIRHQKEQEHLRYLHQLEIENKEKDFITLKNEKLELEVTSKNNELAMATMHLVQRGKVLNKIKEELQHFNKNLNEANKISEIKRVLRFLIEVEKKDDDWEQFSVYFDQVHCNFLATLKYKFPDITANELKLCAYLKMNRTSKEIAQLMSVTVRAVEVNRYRLRKKLNIPSDTNLYDFILKESK